MKSLILPSARWTLVSDRAISRNWVGLVTEIWIFKAWEASLSLRQILHHASSSGSWALGSWQHDKATLTPCSYCQSTPEVKLWWMNSSVSELETYPGSSSSAIRGGSACTLVGDSLSLWESLSLRESLSLGKMLWESAAFCELTSLVWSVSRVIWEFSLTLLQEPLKSPFRVSLLALLRKTSGTQRISS